MRHDSLHAAVRAAISVRLTAAVKARDRISVDALRAALGALDNATAVPVAETRPAHGAPAEVARREPTRVEIEGLLLAEIEARAAAAVEYERLGHVARAGRLRDEAAVIGGTLADVAAVGAAAASLAPPDAGGSERQSTS